MTWVRIDETLPRHPKFLSVGVRGIGLFLVGVCYANEYLTDGAVPSAAVSTVAGEDMTETIEMLVAAGLWIRAADGFQIHDFHDFQPSKKKVLRERSLSKRRKQRYLQVARRTQKERRSAAVRPSTPTRPDPTPVQVQESVLRAGFARFWTVYPRKVGKDAAWAEWLRRSPTVAKMETIIAAVDVQRASAQWHEEGGRWIPHPRTWLHQGRWKDEPLDRPGVELLTPTQRIDASIYRELWRAMPPEHRAWLVGAMGPHGDGVVRLRVVSAEKVEPFRVQLEAVLAVVAPGATLTIGEGDA